MAILLKTLSFSLWLLIMLAIIKAYRRTSGKKTNKSRLYMMEVEDSETGRGYKIFRQLLWDS